MFDRLLGCHAELFKLVDMICFYMLNASVIQHNRTWFVQGKRLGNGGLPRAASSACIFLIGKAAAESKMPALKRTGIGDAQRTWTCRIVKKRGCTNALCHARGKTPGPDR